MPAVITSDEPARRMVGEARVLIVDDHPIVRNGLRVLFDNEPDFCVCAEADGLNQALQQFRETRPDVVVSDISFEGGNGIELVRELISIDPDVRVLICSMHDESLFAERALRAGAKGYIRKGEAAGQLTAAVRRIVGGQVYLSAAMTERMLHLQIGDQKAEKSSVEALSDRELQVFEQIGHGISTRHIARNLHLSPKTVETHREKIKTKLNLSNSTELTQHAVLWVLQGR
ncbi:MAG: response regulator transcription factor [Planctomycetaceae bacterium]